MLSPLALPPLQSQGLHIQVLPDGEPRLTTPDDSGVGVCMRACVGGCGCVCVGMCVCVHVCVPVSVYGGEQVHSYMRTLCVDAASTVCSAILDSCSQKSTVGKENE